MSHHNSHHHARPPEPIVTLVAEGRHKVVSVDTIAERAYEKFVARSRIHGNDREDWVAAERELNSEAAEES